MPLKLNYYGRSDQGLVRKNNEDSLLQLPARQLFAVCDGMGGHNAGEVASRTAVGTITAAFKLESEELRSDPALTLEEQLPSHADLLVKSVRLANRRIYNRASAESELSGMGTTIAAVAFEGNLVSVAHVGDSRVYVYREESLRPLTVDHSWVAEAIAAGQMDHNIGAMVAHKNVITRALGVREVVEVDVSLERVAPRDIFILCTDGLCGFATDSEIERVVRDAKRDLHKITENLIRLANDRGGQDNVTVIAVEAVETGPSMTYAPKPVITIPEETVEGTEREDEWLEFLAERNLQSEKSQSAESQSEPASSNWFVATIVTILVLSAVAIIYFSRG